MFNINHAAWQIHVNMLHDFVNHCKLHVGEEFDEKAKFYIAMMDYLEERYDIRNNEKHSCLGTRDINGDCFICGKNNFEEKL